MTIASAPLLELIRVSKHYALRSGIFAKLSQRQKVLRAVEDVSLCVNRGEVLGLVGESGSGKSTVAQVAVRLTNVSTGQVRYCGQDFTHKSGAELKWFREKVQVVFQDTTSSLNPRKTVARTLQDSLAMREVNKANRVDRSQDLLRMVGLDGSALSRYPHQLSGGQRQRVAIARSLAMQPELLIADEPVASLDVSLQAQIVNLLLRLRAELGLTLLFISHDLALVNAISTRIAVMYAGRIVEEGLPSEVMRQPAHPYTLALLASVPRGLKGRGITPDVTSGAAPEPVHSEGGCAFAPRCGMAKPLCREREPVAASLSTTHRSACHFALDVRGTLRMGAP